jgi:hypothetical protein
MERLAWEGVVDGRTALVIGVIIMLAAAWSLWRERRAVGRAWAVAFWVLRGVAFGVALWMLAGPTQQRVERTTTTQSIAIFADGSESMGVVDPAAPADAVRWALAVRGESADDALVRCDKLGVALGTAQSDCQRFALMVKQHRPSKQLEPVVTMIAATLARATEHGAALVAELDGGDTSERAARISTLIEGPVRESLAAIRAALDRSGGAVGEDFLVRLDQLTEGIQSARRRTQILAADLAQSRAESSNSQHAEAANLSRREKAGRTLDALEKELGDTIDKNVRVERFRFDRTAMPVAVDAGWSGVLDGAPGAFADAGALPNDRAASVDEIGATESATNLSAVFDQLAARAGQRAGHSTRLAVVLSDGRHNDAAAPPPQEVAAQLPDVPIYVVPIGNALMQRDVMLHRVEAPATVAQKDSAVVDVIVTGFDCEGQSTAAVLRHEGREVDRKPVDFSGSRSDARVRFMVPAKELGWQEYIVEIEPVADEANTANNYQPLSFEVVRDRVRVLLADGAARWEYRYLNQLFRRDEHVEFDELLFHPRLHGTGKLVDRPQFPRDVDGWAAYDVVILGDIEPLQLSAESQQALAEFVRTRGGNLLLIAGQNSMPRGFAGQPLMELLPVERGKGTQPQQGYTLRLTDEGRFHSALLIADSAEDSRREWRGVYERFPVFGLNEYSRPKSTARTLIEAESEAAGEVRSGDAGDVEHAFLCWHRFGAGRVAYLSAPETYRLRFRRGDRMHHRFWGQFLRWITAADSGAGADTVRMQTDRMRYMAGEPVEVTLWLKDPSGRPLAGETVQVEARSFNNESRSVELTPDADVAGRYYGTLSALQAGAYQLSVKGKAVEELVARSEQDNQAKATITVTAGDSVEMLNTHSNLALLEQIAQMTGGQVIPPTAISEVLKLVSFTPEVNETIQRMPLWNRWSNLLVVLGCLFTEWIVRKAKGLV